MVKQRLRTFYIDALYEIPCYVAIFLIVETLSVSPGAKLALMLAGLVATGVLFNALLNTFYGRNVVRWIVFATGCLGVIALFAADRLMAMG